MSHHMKTSNLHLVEVGLRAFYFLLVALSLFALFKRSFALCANSFLKENKTYLYSLSLILQAQVGGDLPPSPLSHRFAVEG